MHDPSDTIQLQKTPNSHFATRRFLKCQKMRHLRRFLTGSTGSQGPYKMLENDEFYSRYTFSGLLFSGNCNRQSVRAFELSQSHQPQARPHAKQARVCFSQVKVQNRPMSVVLTSRLSTGSLCHTWTSRSLARRRKYPVKDSVYQNTRSKKLRH